jgi:hypothetical protein
MYESGQTCFEAEHVRILLNGGFLGLYLLVEAVDDHFLEARGMDTLGNTYKASLDGSSLSIFDDPEYHWEQKTGEDINMADLQLLIDGLNQTSQADYSSFVNSVFNRAEMVNILTMNTLLALGSTYYHNYFMHHNPSTNKWSMLPWDMDKTLSYYGATFPYHRSSTIWVPDNPMLERAIISDDLLIEIRQRVVTLESSIFNLNHVTPLIDSLQNAIAVSVAEDETDNITNTGLWLTKINDYKNIFGQRVDNTLQQIDTYPRSFTVDRISSAPPNTEVTLSWTASVSPIERPITYKFFFGPERDLQGTAIIIIENITDTVVQFTTPTDGSYFYKIQANDGFDNVDGFDTYNPIVIIDNVPELVINEINYNSAIDFGTGDWVEIYNPQPYNVSLENWELKDNQNDNFYVFGPEEEITANDYAVVCRVKTDFESLQPTVNNLIGDIPFGFGNSGDRIRLYHSSGLLVDQVTYSDISPWPIEADGSGPTLELNSPELDNSLAENWSAWTERMGTPGAVNYNELSVNNLMQDISVSVFPNPIADDMLQVKILTSNSRSAHLKISDVLGKSVLEQDVSLTSGINALKLKPSLPAPGVYFLTVQSAHSEVSTKFIYQNTK